MNMPKQLSFGREVGSGAYCKIRLLSEDHNTACKICKSDRGGMPSPELREITILAHLARNCHPNIINIKWINASGRSIVIAMSYIPNDLHKMISARSYSDQDIGPIIVGILSGVRHLHTHGIIHRDLKPANVLVDGNKTPKICDFNLAKSFGGFHRAGTHSTNVVTSPYRAPELWRNESYSYGIDTWAVGVILLELYMKRSTWIANSRIENCLTYIRNKKPIYFNRCHGALLRGMLMERVQARWSIERCLAASPIASTIVEKPKTEPPVEVVTPELSHHFRLCGITDQRLKCVTSKIRRLSGVSLTPSECVALARKLLYSDDTAKRADEYVLREIDFVVAHAAELVVDGSTVLKDKQILVNAKPDNSTEDRR